MKEFNIPDADRAPFINDSGLLRRLQAGVSVEANKKMASDCRPNGIFKTEGGVTCNNREIAIKRRYVRDDFGRPNVTTKEEEAVCEALVELVDRVKSGDDLMEYHEQARDLFGNPLVCFSLRL